MNSIRDDLRTRYMQMEDEELVELATTRELTDDAREIIDEVIKSRNISDAEISKQTENFKEQTELSQKPSLVKVEKFWKKLNNSLLYTFVVFIVIVASESLALFANNSMASDLGGLIFLGFFIYMFVNFGFLIAALKRSVLGWYLLSVLCPIPFLGLIITYFVMQSSVQKVRNQVHPSPNPSFKRDAGLALKK